MMNTSLSDDPHGLVYRAAELFMAGYNTERIAEILTSEFRLKQQLNRQRIFPLLLRARSNQLLRLVPPQNVDLEQRLARQFGLHPKSLRVIDTMPHRRPNTTSSKDSSLATLADEGRSAPYGPEDRVAAAAAEWVLELIDEVGRERYVQTLGLGLGPGQATLDFSKSLGDRLQDARASARLKLFALSAGGPALQPHLNPVSFFNLYPPVVARNCIGLFAQTIVRTQEFPALQNLPGIREAFAMRDEIDIVVTGMGDIDDDNDLFFTYLQEAGISRARLRERGWVGNVQYRPYTSSGPASEEPDAIRAVTLFELEDLRALANRKGKHVLMIARRSGLTGRTRATALLPLLTNPTLRVFSELIMDADTAMDLLNHRLLPKVIN